MLKYKYKFLSCITLLITAVFLCSCSLDMEKLQATGATTKPDKSIENQGTKVKSQDSKNLDSLVIKFLDVGQGDSIIIKGKETNILIDAGEKQYADDILNELDSLGIKKLDYIVATHPHSDHIGGFAKVLKNIEIDNVIMPKVSHTSKTYEKLLSSIAEHEIKIKSPDPGTKLDFNDFDIELVAPNSTKYDDLNNYSVGVVLVHGDNRFLMSGDAETLSEQEMLDESRNVEADLIKISHHGSNSSSSKAFLDAVNPKYAVISCGVDNSYNHPHKEVINALTKRKIEILRTDQNGTITAISDGVNIEIKKEK